MDLNAIKLQNTIQERSKLDVFLPLSKAIGWVGNNFIIFLLLSVSCLFLPFFIFQYYGGSYLTYGNESLAYRYFTTYRLISGDPGYIWLPQGYFTLVLQKIILLAQNTFISPYKSFQTSLEWFSTLTNVFQGLLGVLLLMVTFRDKYLTTLQKWIPLVFFFIVIYGTQTSGFYYTLVPDYYQLDIVLLAGCICSYFCIASRNENEISLSTVAVIGLISGVTLVNKISLLFPVMAPVLLLSTKYAHDYKRLRILLSTYASTASLGVILPLIFLYTHQKNISVDFVRWMTFLSSPGAESKFFDNLKTIYLSGSNYFYFYFTLSYLCFWTLAFITIIKRDAVSSRNFLNLILLFGLALLCVVIPLKAHTAGTTNFEAFGSLTALTLMLPAIIPTKTLLYRFQWLILFFWATLFHPISDLHSLAHSSSHSKVNSDIVWAAHNALLDSKGPVLMLLPDNSYGIGSVEELLLKGLSEFPSWNITTGKDLLNKFAPNLSIYAENTTQKLQSNYSSVMWIDKKEEQMSLKEKYPLLNRLAQNYNCKQWQFEGGTRIINVCNRKDFTNV